MWHFTARQVQDSGCFGNCRSYETSPSRSWRVFGKSLPLQHGLRAGWVARDAVPSPRSVDRPGG